eukprot:7994703-Ditylum_brightwellii.AAC.1
MEKEHDAQLKEINEFVKLSASNISAAGIKASVLDAIPVAVSKKMSKQVPLIVKEVLSQSSKQQQLSMLTLYFPPVPALYPMTYSNMMYPHNMMVTQSQMENLNNTQTSNVQKDDNINNNQTNKGSNKDEITNEYNDKYNDVIQTQEKECPQQMQPPTLLTSPPVV